MRKIGAGVDVKKADEKSRRLSSGRGLQIHGGRRRKGTGCRIGLVTRDHHSHGTAIHLSIRGIGAGRLREKTRGMMPVVKDYFLKCSSPNLFNLDVARAETREIGAGADEDIYCIFVVF